MIVKMTVGGEFFSLGLRSEKSRKVTLAVGQGMMRSRPRLPGPVAQRLEPAAHNGLVAGSSPARPTNLSLVQTRPAIKIFGPSDRTGMPVHRTAIWPDTWI
jgi:hypothetical protein